MEIDVDRTHDAVVERRELRKAVHRPVKGCRQQRRPREAPRGDRRRPAVSPVNRHLVAVDRHLAVDLDHRLVLAADVAVAVVGELVDAVRQPADPVAEQPLGVIHRVLKRVADRTCAPNFSMYPGSRRSTRRPAWCWATRSATRSLGTRMFMSIRSQIGLTGSFLLVQLQRRHPQPLGVALGRVRIEGPVHRAADVGPVAQRDREREHLAVQKIGRMILTSFWWVPPVYGSL